MLAIDDSQSMAHNHAGQMALESLATLAKALSQLEVRDLFVSLSLSVCLSVSPRLCCFVTDASCLQVGELGIASFGETTRLLHNFDQPFTDEAGSQVRYHFPPFPFVCSRNVLFLSLTLHPLAGYHAIHLQAAAHTDGALAQ